MSSRCRGSRLGGLGLRDDFPRGDVIGQSILAVVALCFGVLCFGIRVKFEALGLACWQLFYHRRLGMASVVAASNE